MPTQPQMLLCLFVFLWKILRNMSTISATIQQEQQLELLRAQLVEHQRRKLQQLRQRGGGAGGNYQKLRKLCRDKTGVAATTTAKTAATKENFLLHKFLFGLEAVAENGGSVIGDGAGSDGDCDKMDYLSDKGIYEEFCLCCVVY